MSIETLCYKYFHIKALMRETKFTTHAYDELTYRQMPLTHDITYPKAVLHTKTHYSEFKNNFALICQVVPYRQPDNSIL